MAMRPVRDCACRAVRISTPALVVGVLLLLVQSTEAAKQTPTEMTPAPPPDGAAANTPPLSAAHAALISDVETANPSITLQPAVMDPEATSMPPNEAQAALTAQMAAITDADGNSVITGTLADPANTTISVDRDMAGYPGGDDDAANAMLSGAHGTPGGGSVARLNTPKFRNIPFFRFAHEGTTMHGYTETECETACADDADCMSFSYSETKQECIKSKSCVQYDLEFDFYAKKTEMQEGEVGFAHLGAMKYLYTGNEGGVSAHLAKPEAWCKNTCSKDQSCNSFCFRGRDSLCLTSSQSLGYSQGWSYYEKAGAAAKVEEKAQYKSSAPASEQSLALDLKKNSSNPVTEGTASNDENPVVSAQIVAKENAEMSKEQLNYLKANQDQSQETRSATVEAALSMRTDQMSKAQQARVAVAQRVAAKAQTVVNKKLAAEMKGKKMFESEMRATDGKVHFELEHTTKAAWKGSENAVKSSEQQRELTQKETQEDEARTARTKTATTLSEVAQQELEASDDVREMDTRKGIFNDALAHYTELDTEALQRITFLKSEEAKAASMLSAAQDTTKLKAFMAAKTNAATRTDDEQRIQLEKADIIQKADEKIPQLMSDKNAAEILKTDAQGELSQATLASQSASDPADVAQTQKAISDAEAKLAAADSDLTKAVNELNMLKSKVTTSHQLIAESKTKLDDAVSAKSVASHKYQVEDDHLKKLQSDGDVLMESSRFQAAQAINNEFSVKQTLATKQKEELDFEESDAKKKLSVKNLKLRVEELEDATKEQNVEQKVKVAVKFTEKAAKAQQVVEDKIDAAKSDEERSGKMLITSKLAVATAITMDQKVNAAKQESDARMLKVSSEQQMTSLEPEEQAAKEAEETAADKLEALKSMFADDEAGYKKAMSKFNAAASAFAGAKEKGKLNAVEQATNEQMELEQKAAVAQGVKGLSNGYSPKGTASQRASHALSSLSEQDEKLGMKSAALKKMGHGGPLTVDEHIHREKSLKQQVALAKNKETSIKAAIDEHIKTHQVDQANSVQNEKTTSAESDVKEKRSKRLQAVTAKGDAKTELQTKMHEQQMGLLNENTAKSQAKAAKDREGAEKAQVHLNSQKQGYGCEVGPGGKKLPLEAQERCSKDKAGELDDQEKQAKQDAKTREEDLKVLEKSEKDSEKKSKTEQKTKKAQHEIASKESQEKEKTRKATMTEGDQKEDQKKHDEQEKLTKESHQKEMEREEGTTKEAEKKTRERNEKENSTKEAETKTKEKNGKEIEKSTKEKTSKDGMTAKEKKEAQQKISEQNQKMSESESKESKTKSEDESGNKESETKEQQTKAEEKETKERAEKGDAESESKTKEHTTKQQAASSEKTTKTTATKTKEEAEKEKATKDGENEGTQKESAQKVQLQQSTATEVQQKNSANEGQTKVNAQMATTPPVRL